MPDERAVIVRRRVFRLLEGSGALRAAVGLTRPTEPHVQAGLERFAAMARHEPPDVVRTAAAHIVTMLYDLGDDRPRERLAGAFNTIAEETRRGLAA